MEVGRVDPHWSRVGSHHLNGRVGGREWRKTAYSRTHTELGQTLRGGSEGRRRTAVHILNWVKHYEEGVKEDGVQPYTYWTGSNTTRLYTRIVLTTCCPAYCSNHLQTPPPLLSPPTPHSAPTLQTLHSPTPTTTPPPPSSPPIPKYRRQFWYRKLLNKSWLRSSSSRASSRRSFKDIWWPSRHACDNPYPAPCYPPPTPEFQGYLMTQQACLRQRCFALFSFSDDMWWALGRLWSSLIFSCGVDGTDSSFFSAHTTRLGSKSTRHFKPRLHQKIFPLISDYFCRFALFKLKTNRSQQWNTRV